jgi:hypothetical protein
MPLARTQPSLKTKKKVQEMNRKTLIAAVIGLALLARSR